MMQLKEIGHVLLRVLDLERSKKFYSEVLGFQVLEEDPEHGGTFMALKGQSHAIDLFQVKDADAAQRQTPGVRGLGHIAFRVDRRGRSRTPTLAPEHGVAISRTIDHVSQKSIYFDDPDGNTLEFTTSSRTPWRCLRAAARIATCRSFSTASLRRRVGPGQHARLPMACSSAATDPAIHPSRPSSSRTRYHWSFSSRTVTGLPCAGLVESSPSSLALPADWRGRS